MALFFLILNPLPMADAALLKLADAPLTQVIELYSQETGHNVFVDESVQKQRRVTVFLQDMTIEDAFELIQKTVNLESCMVGTSTLVIFPPEKEQRYRGNLEPTLIRLPEGIDPGWVTGVLGGILPGLRTARVAGDATALVIFGKADQISQVRNLATVLPEVEAAEGRIQLNQAEARIIIEDIKEEGVAVALNPSGLIWSGEKKAVERFERALQRWRHACRWGVDVVSPVRLDHLKALAAAKVIQGRAVISDLGGTGSLMIEGPQSDRSQVKRILKQLDEEAKVTRQEMVFSELLADTAQKVLKMPGLTVDKAGDRNVILSGKEEDVRMVSKILKALDRKPKQVLIRFRLAEVARSQLKKLGIELDKNAYGYQEIRDFHSKDILPLILKVMDEGKYGKILAEPNIRVLEGETAKVTIGDRIPLEVAATAQTDSGSTLKLNTQLSWVDVGIKMEIRKLSVDPDGAIRMSLSNEVSSVVSTTKQGYPQIRTREAESVLRIPNGGSALMSGLISQEERTNHFRIPVISRIPFLGGLARSRDRDKVDTEIIMIVTGMVAEQ